ncbi:MAG TPA: HPF/RaiA family ribosome-associated protein [Verrucomicrobiota bacterium]|nr:HPF/RaiA family ribosome-associated protein [Verrucomicrobiota bacterium]HRZ38435.1 HPF/RaiA family ribosome-associated protein [Candidatus Paceibacterota bacterium]HRZ58214.1 HPF/RaiA family ribosome-associated protein [Candidatus Paceibacterota bacterium]
MKIHYQVRGMPTAIADDRPMDLQLEHLDRLLPISRAHVVVERQPNTTPAFRASVDLAVSGPDIHAAARDHTLEAVLLKVARRLEEQIQGRKNRQQLRLKDRRQPRTLRSSIAR